MSTKAQPQEAPKRQTLTFEAREFMKSIEQEVKRQGWGAPQSFERKVCGCKPHRKLQEELLKERDKALAPLLKRKARLEAQIKETSKPFDERNAELQNQIYKIDRIDHPKAQRLWQNATQWVTLWVREKLLAGELAGLDAIGAVEKFYDDLAAGWTPKAPEKVFN